MEKALLFRVVGWFAKALGLLFVAVISGIGFRYALIQANGNFRAVETGRVYRSGQLSEEEFARQVKKLGIRSVINLRGENPGESWYDAEAKVAKTLDVSLINFRMSARVVMSVEQMQELALVMNGAPKPMLIHCMAGSDRTGLASAIYCLEEGMAPTFVRLQLSTSFGHFPYLYSETMAMDQSLEQYLRMKTAHVEAERLGVSR